MPLKRRLTLSELGVDPLSAQAEETEAAGSVPTSATVLSDDELPTSFPFVGPNKAGRLWAIADIHLSYEANREALQKLRHYPNDGLIICGDVGESPDQLELAFKAAKERFRTVWWTPGNHELYTLPTQAETGARGEAKYEECVKIARSHGVLTPEDPYTLWEGEGGPCVIAPTFTLYDYSFRPDNVSLERAVEWAKEENVEATDEFLLHYEPHASRQDWCNALVEKFKRRLEEAHAAHPNVPLIIANHWPLRQDLVYLKWIPRFSLWCGTKQTEEWHKLFNAKVVVSGHLHIRRTDWKDGTRFEECSLGYPKQWKESFDEGLDINDFLREILPGPKAPPGGSSATLWRRGLRTSENPAELFAKK